MGLAWFSHSDLYWIQTSIQATYIDINRSVCLSTLYLKILNQYLFIFKGIKFIFSYSNYKVAVSLAIIVFSS